MKSSTPQQANSAQEKPISKKVKRGKKKSELLILVLIIILVSIGFVGIPVLDGLMESLPILIGFILIVSIIAFALFKSPLKHSYYYSIGFSTLAIFTPTTYVLYRLGGILMVIMVYLCWIILLILSTKLAKSNK